MSKFELPVGEKLSVFTVGVKVVFWRKRIFTDRIYEQIRRGGGESVWGPLGLRQNIHLHAPVLSCTAEELEHALITAAESAHIVHLHAHVEDGAIPIAKRGTDSSGRELEESVPASKIRSYLGHRTDAALNSWIPRGKLKVFVLTGCVSKELCAALADFVPVVIGATDVLSAHQAEVWAPHFIEGILNQTTPTRWVQSALDAAKDKCVEILALPNTPLFEIVLPPSSSSNDATAAAAAASAGSSATTGAASFIPSSLARHDLPTFNNVPPIPAHHTTICRWFDSQTTMQSQLAKLIGSSATKLRPNVDCHCVHVYGSVGAGKRYLVHRLCEHLSGNYGGRVRVFSCPSVRATGGSLGRFLRKLTGGVRHQFSLSGSFAGVTPEIFVAVLNQLKLDRTLFVFQDFSPSCDSVRMFFEPLLACASKEETRFHHDFIFISTQGLPCLRATPLNSIQVTPYVDSRERDEVLGLFLAPFNKYQSRVADQTLDPSANLPPQQELLGLLEQFCQLPAIGWLPASIHASISACEANLKMGKADATIELIRELASKPIITTRALSGSPPPYTLIVTPLRLYEVGLYSSPLWTQLQWMMACCSFYQSHHIPCSAFAAHLPDFEYCMQVLRDRAIVYSETRMEERPVFSIHPVLMMSLRDELLADEPSRVSHRFSSLPPVRAFFLATWFMLKLFVAIAPVFSDTSRCRFLLPHLDHLCQILIRFLAEDRTKSEVLASPSFAFLASLLFEFTADVHGISTNHQRKREYLEQAMKIVQMHQRSEDVWTMRLATLYNNRGIVLGALGCPLNDQLSDFDHAKTLKEKLVKSGFLSEWHPSPIITMLNRGVAYKWNDDEGAQQRIAILEEALKACNKYMGDKGRYNGPVLSSLSNAYFHQQNYKKQLACVSQALAIKLRHFGPTHLEVGLTLANLGAAHAALGHISDARRHYEHALIILHATIGPHHPYAAIARANMDKLSLVGAHLDDAAAAAIRPTAMVDPPGTGERDARIPFRTPQDIMQAVNMRDGNSDSPKAASTSSNDADNSAAEYSDFLSSPELSFVYVERNVPFGRDAEPKPLLYSIMHHLDQLDTPSIVLHGISGCGKTHVTVYYALERMICYAWRVFRFDMESNESLMASMHIAAKRMGLSHFLLSLAQLTQLVAGKIQQETMCLILLDNVDSLEMMQFTKKLMVQFCRADNRAQHHFLITSILSADAWKSSSIDARHSSGLHFGKNDSTHEIGHFIELDQFSVPDATRFMKRILGADRYDIAVDESLLGQLFKCVGTLPLALDQVAGVLLTGVTLKEYLNGFTTDAAQRRSFLNRHSLYRLNKKKRSLYETFLINFQHVCSNHPLISLVMNRLAFLEPSRISLANAIIPLFRDDQRVTHEQLHATLALLRQYSFLRGRAYSKDVSMHGALQETLSLWLQVAPTSTADDTYVNLPPVGGSHLAADRNRLLVGAESYDDVLVELICKAKLYYRFDEHDLSTFQTFGEVQPHLAKLLEHFRRRHEQLKLGPSHGAASTDACRHMTTLNPNFSQHIGALVAGAALSNASSPSASAIHAILQIACSLEVRLASYRRHACGDVQYSVATLDHAVRTYDSCPCLRQSQAHAAAMAYFSMATRMAGKLLDALRILVAAKLMVESLKTKRESEQFTETTCNGLGLIDGAEDLDVLLHLIRMHLAEAAQGCQSAEDQPATLMLESKLPNNSDSSEVEFLQARANLLLDDEEDDSNPVSSLHRQVPIVVRNILRNPVQYAQQELTCCIEFFRQREKECEGADRTRICVLRAHACKYIAELYRRHYSSHAKLTFALDLARKASELYRKSLGDRHPYSIEILDTEANILDDLGQWKEAAEAANSALNKLKDVVAEGHPMITNATYSLALIYMAQNRIADCKLQISRTRAGCRSSTYDGNLNVFLALLEFYVYDHDGQQASAIACLNLVISELEAQSVSKVALRRVLSWRMPWTDGINDTIDYLKVALQLLQRIYDAPHPCLFNLQRRLVLCYSALQGDERKKTASIRLHRKSMQKMWSALSEDTPEWNRSKWQKLDSDYNVHLFMFLLVIVGAAMALIWCNAVAGP